MINGTALANHLDAIVVTFNYRLSIFGFPGMKIHPFAPMNPGYADQQLALQWVRSKINHFAGDPTNVCLAAHLV